MNLEGKPVKRGDKLWFRSIKAGKIKCVATLVFDHILIAEVTSKNKGNHGYYEGVTLDIQENNPWISRRH